MKRVFLIAVCLALILPLAVVNATPTEDLRWTVESRIGSINTELNRNYVGQSGLLRKLQYISAKVLWVQFSEDGNGEHGLDYPETYLMTLREDLNRDIERFNESYSKAPLDRNYLELTLTSIGANPQTSYETLLSTTVPNYIKKVLDPIKKSYDNAESDEGKTLIVRENRDILRYSYKIVETIIDVRNDIAILSPGLIEVTDSQAIRELMSSRSEFNLLLQRGKEIDISLTTVVGSTEVDRDGESITRLANVELKSGLDSSKDLFGPDLWIPTDQGSDLFTLKDVYLKYLASGAVYRPLVSKVGDDEFISALRGLYDTEEQGNLAVGLFQKLKEHKKPLFRTNKSGYELWATYGEEGLNGRTTSSSADYTGTSELVRVRDLMDWIDGNGTFALVTKRGSMKENPEDMNSFSFFSDNPSGEPLILSKGSEIDSGVAWTAPVLLFNTSSWNTAEVTGSFTSTILRHIKASIVDSNEFNNSLDLLFVNVFGDIVTQNNTVILPAAANPIIYKNLDRDSYYPYTVTFMSPYPDIKVTDGEASVRLFEGRYLFASRSKKANVYTAIAINDNKKTKVMDTLMAPTFRTDLAESVGGITSPFKMELYTQVDEKGFFGRFWDQLLISSKQLVQLSAANKAYGATDVTTDEYEVLVYDDIVLQGRPLFRYDPVLDSDHSVAKYIARNWYQSLMVDSKGTVVAPTEFIDQDYIFRNMLLEGLNGTLYGDSYTKNVMTNQSIEDSMGPMKNIVLSLARNSLDNVGATQGLLGTKNLYEDKYFGPLMEMIDTYLMIIVAVVVMLFLFKYLRDKENFIFLSVCTFLSVIALLVFLKWIPMYTPSIINTFVNNTSDEVGYDILALKTERYDKTYMESGAHESSSLFKINGTTLTLYKFTESQLATFKEENSIEPGDLSGNSIYLLDSTNGVFLEGNSIKVSSDLLFKNIPIQGSWNSDITGANYQITANKKHSSAIDYYMPFSLIQDGFIYSLNNLTKVYQLPHNVLTYRSGITKDSFLVSSFANSAPFLDPTNYDNPNYEFSIEEITQLEYYFDNPADKTNSYDFLNLDRILSNPSEEMRESLWYRTMEGAGYFDDSEKYWNLIEATNLQTKKFIIELDRSVFLMSDENLIKIISLYATAFFNNRISEFNNYVYPTSLNYQDFFTSDVYLAVFTDTIDAFISEDMDTATFVVANTAIPIGLIFVAEVWISYVIKGIIPLLMIYVFVSFSVLLVIRFAFTETYMNVIKGATKLSLSLFVIAIVFYLSFGLASKMGTSAAILFLFVVHLVLMYAIFMLLTALIFNIYEFGDGKFKATLDKFASPMMKIGRILDPRNRNKGRVAYGGGHPGDSYVQRYGLDYQYERRYLKDYDGRTGNHRSGPNSSVHRVGRSSVKYLNPILRGKRTSQDSDREDPKKSSSDEFFNF